MPFKSILVAVNGKNLFFFMTEWYSIVYIYHIFFIHSVDGHLGCIHILAIINNAAMNIEVHVSFQISVFSFFEYIYPGVEFLTHMMILFLVF